MPYVTYIWNLKNKTSEYSRPTDIENKLMVFNEDREGKDNIGIRD